MTSRWFLRMIATLGALVALPGLALAQGEDDALQRLTLPTRAMEYPHEALMANQEGTTIL